MRNFYEAAVPLGGLLDFKLYFQTLYRVVELDQTDSIDCPENRMSIQRLASNAFKIWKAFNEDRTLLDKYYMDTWTSLQAYAASFLLPNIERIFSLLADERHFVELQKAIASQREEFVVMDFGSGPLSASVGFLAALSYAQSQGIELPKVIKIYAVERSQKSFELGKMLIESAIIEGETKIIIERLSSQEKLPKKINLALAANIFNEIPEKHQIKTLHSLLSYLADEALFLIIEPGQETHARRLSALRDEALQNQSNKKKNQQEGAVAHPTPTLKVIGPCLHDKPCPLGEHSGRKDWCWFRHSWNPPLLLSLLGKYSKIDYYELNFSYLMLKNENISRDHHVDLVHSALPSSLARCVSDPFAVDLFKSNKLMQYVKNNVLTAYGTSSLEDLEKKMNPEERIQKVLLCTIDGMLESEYFQIGNVHGLRKRGHIVQFEELVTLRVFERQAQSKEI
ncbi:MAG: hypothetical protein K2X39_06205 [Silvanigrellaceae bacterium]|nr:hypothetical protein [Silvanigrellaceae bacterium]